MHPQVRTGLIGLVLVAVTGGCTVTAGNSTRDAQREAAEAVVGDGSVTVDLTDPPSREELAVPEERTTVFLQRDGREPFDVTVRFRDGHELTTPAAVLGVETDGPGTAPKALTIRRDEMTLDDLRAALDSAVADLGVDRADADDALRRAEQAGSGDKDLIVTLRTAVADPDRLELEPVVSAMEGRVSINYLVHWDTP